MKTTRREILALAAMGALGAWPASAETASQSAEAPLKSNQADFDQVWEFVRDRFYDPHLNGLDWQEERARFGPQAASARSREDAAAVVLDARHLPVHQHRRADHLAAECVPDPLMPEAHAEDRNPPPELADHVHGDPRLLRTPWSGRCGRRPPTPGRLVRS